MEYCQLMGWGVNDYVSACMNLEIDPSTCTLLFIVNQWGLIHGVEPPPKCIYSECECYYNEVEWKFKEANEGRWS